MPLATEDLMNRVRKTRATPRPGGLANLIVLHFMEEHHPKDHINKVEAQRKPMEIKPSPGENPKKTFERTSKI